MIVLAVFGQPVYHSLSPRIHTQFAEEAGLEIVYTAIEAGPGTLGEALVTFRARGGVGCNVTMPLKGEAAQLATTRTDQVERAQAANTLVLDGDHWAADSTDGAGLVSDLDRLGLGLAGARVLMVGAGGAAASVAAALLHARPALLTIANRDIDKAIALASRHGDLGPVDTARLEEQAVSPYDLVINATSLGHGGDRVSLPPGAIGPDSVLYDLNYGTAAQPLVRWAESQGVRCHDGLGMLVGQAAASFRLWTGYDPDVAPVLERLRSG